jgi:EamA-like transporter family/Phosphotransferase enzyme family
VLASLLLSATFTVAQGGLLRGRDPVAVTAVQFLGAALAVLPFSVITEGAPPAPPAPGAVLAAVALAAGGTVLPFTLFAYGQSRVSAEVAGAFYNIEPLVGAVIGVVAFGDPAGVAQAVGGAAIVAGIALSSLPLLSGGAARPVTRFQGGGGQQAVRGDLARGGPGGAPRRDPSPGGPDRAAAIRRQAERLADDLSGIGHLAGERVVIHGDFTNHNVIAAGTPSRAAWVIDFALAHAETPLADIGYGLWRSGRPRQDADHLDLSRIRRFVAGYASTARLSADEARAITVYLGGRGLQMIAKRVRAGRAETGMLAQVHWISAHAGAVGDALASAAS